MRLARFSCKNHQTATSTRITDPGAFPLSRFIINPRFACLLVLKLARDAVDHPVLAKACAGLVKRERDLGIDALPVQVEHPVIIAHPGTIAAFAADRDTLDVLVELR